MQLPTRDAQTNLVKEHYAVIYSPRKHRNRFPENCVTLYESAEAAVDAADDERDLYAARVIGPSRSSEGSMLYYLVHWLTQGLTMQCRAGCGACCIAPSISSPIPGMPAGKAPGERCIQLDAQNRCLLFGQPSRPAVCSSFAAEPDTCGDRREEALQALAELEAATARG